MEEMLLYTAIILLIFVMFAPTLFASGVAIYDYTKQKKQILPLVLGVIVACFLYALLFFGIETIAHEVDYSNYGKKFSNFYLQVLSLFVVGVFLLYFLYYIKYKNHSFFQNFQQGYLIGIAIFLVIPDRHVAYLLSMTKMTHMAIGVFAWFNQISYLSVYNDIYGDLIVARYNLDSDLMIVFFYLCNNVVAINFLRGFFKKSHDKKQSEQ